MEIAGLVKGIAVGIIGCVVILILLGQLAPEIRGGQSNITASNLPLSGMFSSLVPLLIMVGAFIALVVLSLSVAKGKV